MSPIFKKGDKKQPENGLRSGHSCATQLLCVLEEWSKALDCNENVDVIYLDFRKAFDTVPHARLINKLYAYGIRDRLLRWIQNFLTNRKQKVIVQGEESQWADVTSGIPQGSVLGPVLFLIYINDLPDAIKKFVTIFADDTKEHAVIRIENDTIEVQEDLYEKSDWPEIWEIRFKTKKYKSLHMGKSNPKTVYYMKEGDRKIPLEQVTEEKDLGVTFCDTLKFDKHILNYLNKANKILGIVKRTFTYMNRDMFIQLYKSLIRPNLEYATVIWNPYLKKNIFLIENVQRRATKLISEIAHLPYEQRLRNLGLPTLNYRRCRSDMNQVYKILNKIDDIPVDKFFTISESNRTRGHKYKLVKWHNRT